VSGSEHARDLNPLRERVAGKAAVEENLRARRTYVHGLPCLLWGLFCVRDMKYQAAPPTANAAPMIQGSRLLPAALGPSLRSVVLANAVRPFGSGTRRVTGLR